MVSEIAGEQEKSGEETRKENITVCVYSRVHQTVYSGGHFAFVTNDKMSIFHYSTEFGVAFTPVEPEDIWHFTMGEQQLLLFFGCILFCLF